MESRAEQKGISKLDLKRRNRRQILLEIREYGMLARVDIANHLGLTRAAVTIITNQMIQQGILEDLSGTSVQDTEQPRRKGRRKTMIRINPTYKYVLGAVVEESFVSVGISDLAGTVIAQDSTKITASTEKHEIVNFIVKKLMKLMDKSNIAPKQVLGLGVGITPKHWEMFRAVTKNGAVTFENLSETLHADLYGIKVCTASTVSMYALANIDYSDNSNGSQVLIYSGSSYHSAAVSGKKLLGGYSTNTDSIDRLVIVQGGRQAEGYPPGSVHAELTVPALEAKAAEAGKPMTIEEMNAAYLAGDKVIRAILDDAVYRMAHLIYNRAVSQDVSNVTLQGFRLNEKTKKNLCDLIAELSGSKDKPRVSFSDIAGERAFLAGCSLATEVEFYDRGGLPPEEAWRQ